MNNLESSNEMYRRQKEARIDAETDASCVFQPLNAEVLFGWYNLECNQSDEAYQLFYDVYSDTFFKSTISHVIQAEYHLNRNYILQGYVTINEWYEFLGLSVRMDNDKIGWVPDSGIYWIDFGHTRGRTRSGLTYYKIEFAFDPEVLQEV